MKLKINDIDIVNECKRLMNYHVILLLKDEIQVDGIIQYINTKWAI